MPPLLVLDLYNNSLAELPDEICGLASLERLSAKSNKIRCLPERLGDLAALTHLYLDQNELSSLPGSCSRLTKLEVVGLDWNDLRCFPDCLCDVAGLKQLFLCENPELQSMSPEARVAGFRALELMRTTPPNW